MLRAIHEWAWLALAGALLMIMVLNPAPEAPRTPGAQAALVHTPLVQPAFVKPGRTLLAAQPAVMMVNPPMPRASPRAAATIRQAETKSRLGLAGVVLVMLLLTLLLLAASAPPRATRRAV